MASGEVETMPKRNPGYGAAGRVNFLKKVKVGKTWNFYPAVVESNGKLTDKVRVKDAVRCIRKASIS